MAMEEYGDDGSQSISTIAQPISQTLNNKKQLMACSDHKTVVEKMRERERTTILFLLYITSCENHHSVS